MAKKGPALQLQTELNNDEEWEKFLEKEGLLVIDIYSDWCGPCSAMQAVLKKIKVEVGGDLLQLAIAKSDDISVLERFRTKSEPTWMFISNGKIVNLMYGANSPKLQRLILAELKKEESFRQGQIERDGVDPSERFGIENERYQEEEAKAKAIIEREEAKRIKEEFERKRKEAQNILETMNSVGIALIMAHAKPKYQDVLNDLLNEAGLTIKERERVKITERMLEQIYYFCDKPPFSEAVLNDMQENDVLVLMIKPGKDVDIGKIDKPLLQLVYGDMEKPPGSAGSPSQLLYKEIKPVIQPLSSVAEMASSSLSLPGKEVIAQGDEEEEEGDEDEEEDAIEKHELEETEELLPPEPDKPVFIERTEEDIIGIWVPPNDRVRATCFKLFFKKFVNDSLIPEPEPIPPHLAFIFDLNKQNAVKKVMSQFPNAVMRYGFFEDEDLMNPKLVAKSFKKLEVPGTKRTFSEKLILQVSKKTSQCIFEFAQLGPIHMSTTAEDGKIECHRVFGEDYDEPDIETPPEEVVVVTKKKRKSVRASQAIAEDEGEEEDEFEEAEDFEEEHEDYEGDELEDSEAQLSAEPEAEATSEPIHESASIDEEEQ